MSETLEGGEEARTSSTGPESVACHEDLVRLLAAQFARADLSLREVQARADKAGGPRVPRATCADMLAGRRFPKKAMMTAFLRACRVPEHQLPAWEQAWERARLSQPPDPAGEGRVPGVAAQDLVREGGVPEVSAQDLVEESGVAEVPGQDLVGEGGVPGVAAVGRRGWRYALVLAAAVAAVGVAVWGVPRLGASWAPGRVVIDDGRAFDRGGSSRFTVAVNPANTGIRLIRRLDAGIARQRATITVNGAPAGEWRPLPGEGIYRWRDQRVDLPRQLTDGRRSLTVVNTFVSSAQDFNEFLYTVQQRVEAAWSTVDTVDVGPAHTAAEAAHHYRLTGRQTFEGTQKFTYPPAPEPGAAADDGNT